VGCPSLSISNIVVKLITARVRFAQHASTSPGDHWLRFTYGLVTPMRCSSLPGTANQPGKPRKHHKHDPTPRDGITSSSAQQSI